MKRCFKCKKDKDYSEFVKDKNQKDGHYTYCKDCSGLLFKKHSQSLSYKKRHNKQSGEWEKRNRIAKRAHRIVRKAKQTGKLLKPKNCSLCLQIKKRIEAHHSDYLRPLDVIWLCPRCHHKINETDLLLNTRC